MPIEPDQKEVMWYKLDELVSIDPDALPHYWEVLSQKHLELEYSLMQDYRNESINHVYFCLTCGESEMHKEKPNLFFKYKGKLYCKNDYKLINKKLKKIIICEDHKPVLMNAVELIKYIKEEVLKLLVEPDGRKMTLYELESYMFGHHDSNFFDTKDGYLSKGVIKSKLHKIKEVLIIRLAEVRPFIRFSSTMRTPSIHVG